MKAKDQEEKDSIIKEGLTAPTIEVESPHRPKREDLERKAWPLPPAFFKHG